MILQYFKNKKNKDKNLSNIIYYKISNLTEEFIALNNSFKKKDFNTTFEIFSIFLIFYLKCIRDSKINNYKEINQDLINTFINDLDYSLREEGIGDMSIGKHVKSYVKKFYYRLSKLEKILYKLQHKKLNDFFIKLNYVNDDSISIFSENIYKIYLNIQLEIKRDYII